MTYPSVDDRLAEEVRSAAGCEGRDVAEVVHALRRRTAHWVDRGERLWTVREGDDGVAALRLASGGSPFEQSRRIVERGPYDELRQRIDDRAEVAP